MTSHTTFYVLIFLLITVVVFSMSSLAQMGTHNPEIFNIKVEKF